MAGSKVAQWRFSLVSSDCEKARHAVLLRFLVSAHVVAWTHVGAYSRVLPEPMHHSCDRLIMNSALIRWLPRLVTQKRAYLRLTSGFYANVFLFSARPVLKKPFKSLSLPNYLCVCGLDFLLFRLLSSHKAGLRVFFLELCYLLVGNFPTEKFLTSGSTSNVFLQPW